MAGICGIFRFNGAQAEKSVIDRMTSASAFRGPDGTNSWLDGNAALSHLAFHTTPQSVLERQPLHSRDQRLHLVTDSRIDNREELIPRLFPDIQRSERDAITDAEIILAAYSKWGQECPGALVGDFAFLIWDQHAQQLFAARDAMGVRQLYYVRVGETIYIATTIDSVLSALNFQPTLNRPLIEDFLCGNHYRRIKETIYQGILRLPPAHHMCASFRKLKIQSYYSFGSQPPSGVSNDDQWVDAFRELFENVLVAQLRSPGPVAVALSGGLDSSAIACAAHEISRKQTVPEVKLISILYENTPRADEKEYFHEVALKCPDFKRITPPGDHLWSFLDANLASGFPLEEPDLGPGRELTMALLGAGPQNGCRVTLSGDFSNLVLGDLVYYHPRLLRHTSLLKLHTELKHFRRISHKSSTGVLIRAYTPNALIRAYHKWLMPLFSSFRSDDTPWVNRAEEGAGNFVPGVPAEVSHIPTLSPAGKVVLQHSLSHFNIARLSMLDSISGFVGAEHRIPYTDRRILEFALHMPQHLMCSDGIGRVILRRSMSGMVPDSVLKRTGSPGPTQLFNRGFKKESAFIERLLEDMWLEKLGFIDGAEFRRWMQSHWPSEEVLDPQYAYARGTIMLEIWLRARKQVFHS